MRSLLALPYFLLFTLVAQAQSFYHSQISTDQPAVSQFLKTAEDLLPLRMKSAFPAGIEVQFTLDTEAHGQALVKSPESKVLINRKLVDVILRGEKQSRLSKDSQGNLRTHKTEYREALATILHETAHLYDYKNLQTVEMLTKINWCIGSAQSEGPVTNSDCDIYKSVRTTISSNPYYLELAGWMLMADGKGDRNRENSFQFRSPDEYEFQNPQEHFAVNFEYFIMDPEYACRRPSLAKFFSGYFGVKTSEGCVINTQYVDPDGTDTKDLFHQIPIDRVYQVHYLLAAAGSSMMSRFGHSMIRLVICAPGKVLGPECLKDSIPYDLVLSYRAFVNSPQLSAIAGLSGKYPSRLYVLPLQNIIQEYNEDEYRDLKSYPLNLTRQEIRSVIIRALESHWSYEGRYFFATNNCAVETLNLLRGSLLRPELLDKRVIYPNDLASLLLKEKIAGPIPSDKTQALEQGYYFESFAGKHLLSYNLVFQKQASLGEVQDFMKLPAEKRRELYNQQIQTWQKPYSYKQLASPYQLELSILRRQQSEFQSAIMNNILQKQNAQSAEGVALSEVYQKSLAAFGALSAPFQILDFNNYGIPNATEIFESTKALEKVKQSLREAREVESHTRDELKKENSTYAESLKTRELMSYIIKLK